MRRPRPTRAAAAADRARLALEDYLPYLVNRVGAALVERFCREALDRHGLGIAIWRVLAALSRNGALRQVDLAAMTSIEPSTLSRLVTRAVRRGLATRARSRHSNREVLVELSPKGRVLVARLIPVARALEATAVAGLPRAELAAAKRALRRMHANLAPPSAAPASRLQR